MKLSIRFLLTALLFALASVTWAAETPQPAVELPAPAAEQPSGDDTAAETLTTPAEDCDAAKTALVGTALDDIAYTTQTCGPCSSGGCSGATRGQLCWAGGQGWGACNIFSGGFMCPQGGWDCQCSTGDLP
ncbi:MAG: hypothetical protein MI919_22960 [Holophagales bacterium]|nr:hypothetical protein [Holophagales bacterium]